MTARELALVLAGLRALQELSLTSGGDVGHLHDILDGASGPDDMTLAEEIDELCERLNRPEEGK